MSLILRASKDEVVNLTLVRLLKTVEDIDKQQKKVEIKLNELEILMTTLEMRKKRLNEKVKLLGES